MSAVLVLPWLFVGAATAIGAHRVGRRLDDAPRRRLWWLSAVLVVPAGYAGLRWAGLPDPSALELLFPTGLAMAVVGLGWWLVGALAKRDAWEPVIPFVQWVASAAGVYAAFTWVIYRIFVEPQLLNPLIAVFGSTHTFVGLTAPGLASLVPAALAWPDEEDDRDQGRLWGTWLLVAYLVVWSVRGIVGIGSLVVNAA